MDSQDLMLLWCQVCQLGRCRSPGQAGKVGSSRGVGGTYGLLTCRRGSGGGGCSSFSYVLARLEELDNVADLVCCIMSSHKTDELSL